MTNGAANDTTASETIARGTTYQSSTWRAHRFHSHIEVTDLRNAGKRGKVCARFDVGASAFGHDEEDEQMETVAPFIFAACRDGVSVETMAATLADVALAGLRFTRSEVKACHVDAAPRLQLDADLVRGQFTPSEALVTFTAIHNAAPVETRIARGLQMIGEGAPSSRAVGHVQAATFRQDTHVGTDSRRDAAKVYAWARENMRRLAGMTITEFRAEMSAIGARVS